MKTRYEARMYFRNDTVNMEQTKPIDVYHHGKDVVDFAPFEHKHIGDKVCITSENMGRLNSLKLPNGLVLSLGQIIALAGDFWYTHAADYRSLQSD